MHRLIAERILGYSMEKREHYWTDRGGEPGGGGFRQLGGCRVHRGQRVRHQRRRAAHIAALEGLDPHLQRHSRSMAPRATANTEVAHARIMAASQTKNIEGEKLTSEEVTIGWRAFADRRA